MNTLWLMTFSERLGFTDSESEALLAAARDPVAEVIAHRYCERRLTMEDALIWLRRAGDPAVSIYTRQWLFLCLCAEDLRADYAAFGVPDAIFWDTIADIRYKLRECETVYGVPGIFVPSWYDGFFRMRRFALGRLQYERARLDADVVSCGSLTLHRGDTVWNCHIPSSGPLTPESVLDSLRRAYEFYQREIPCGILPLVCHSWLLSPALLAILPAGSRVAAFASLFRLLHAEDPDGRFSDAWRVFGREYAGDVLVLPSDTAMRRAIRDHLASGRGIGYGYGILFFDGEKILPTV